MTSSVLPRTVDQSRTPKVGACCRRAVLASREVGKKTSSQGAWGNCSIENEILRTK
jgi:hypothetical protein